jgi:hypothetical protein
MANNKSKGIQNASIAKDDGGKEISFCQITEDKIKFDNELLKDLNFWIADSGRSSHSTGHDGMTDLDSKMPGGAMVTSSGQAMVSASKGKLPVAICDKGGNKITQMTLNSIKHIPGQVFNLMSMAKLQSNSWKSHGDKKAIRMTKDGQEIVFDIVIPTEDGCVFAIYLKRRTVAQGDVADHTPASKPNERQYMDLALFKKKPRMPVLPKSNWLVTVDEQTQLTTTKFFKSKNSIVEPVCVLFDQWRQAGKAASFMHCDNAGENKKTQERASSEAWKPGLEFKYTARATPQQNHLAELAFAMLGARGRALMIEANIYSHGFGHACADHTRQQDSILVQPMDRWQRTTVRQVPLHLGQSRYNKAQEQSHRQAQRAWNGLYARWIRRRPYG